MAKWPYCLAMWQRYRGQKLQRDPLCEACLEVGRIEPAEVVDHRIPINAGGNPFPPLDELMSLCVRCHNAKTRAEQMGKVWTRGTRAIKGCDVSGSPLDPNHCWYRK
jgi:5-methylcytosine-specific restriction protein A